MSRKIVDLHPEAIAEGREARQWYLSRSTQAEEAFRRELERAIRLIRDTPKTWPRYLHGTRRVVLTGFPYSIVYTTDGSYSLVLAIAHAKRKPGYWKKRSELPGR